MKRTIGKGNIAAAIAALSVAMMAATTGCSPGRSAPTGGNASGDGDLDGVEELGGVGLALELAPGVTVDAVSYSIMGPAGFSRAGSIDTSHSTTISIVIPALPSGTGYSITVGATAGDLSTTCSGSASFDVTAQVTTAVSIHLICHEAPSAGSISVSGTINVCPGVDGISANPSQVLVGSPIGLSVLAHDEDRGPASLSYRWSAPSGAFSDPTAASPTYTCGAPGPVKISVVISDGDPTAGCAALATVQVTCAIPGAGGPATPLTVAVYGDAPYGTTSTDTAEFQATPAFIASINADPEVALVMHVGDIHSGKQLCTEAYDRSIYDLWTAFEDPLVYTPGDNEWSDCHKAAEGGGTYNPATQEIDFVLDGSGNPVDYAGGDPIANLALVRSIFFPSAGLTLGHHQQTVLSQAQVSAPLHPLDAAYVENVMWEQSKVLFVNLNLPGGSNNDADVWYGAPNPTAAQVQEIANRTAADLRWLDLAFAQAQADGVVAIVIEAQADMWDPEKGPAHQAGYEPFVQSIASHTTAFARPVIMFNGDSHVYLSHNPLAPTDALYFMHPGYDVPNFHRVVVHGSTFPLEWLRLKIDPQATAPEGPTAFGPFSWERVIP